MKNRLISLPILLLTFSCTVAQAATIPSDVQAFQDNAEDCQHFAGEWVSSLAKSEQKKIEASVDKYCGIARKQQKQLQKNMLEIRK